MQKTVEFIVLATTFDTTRVDRGLYHHPKLLHARALRNGLKKKFAEVITQIDPDRDAVALCVRVPLTAQDPEKLTSELQHAFDEIKGIILKKSGNSQHLTLFTQSSCKFVLEEAGVKTPLPFNILKPDS